MQGEPNEAEVKAAIEAAVQVPGAAAAPAEPVGDAAKVKKKPGRPRKENITDCP